MAAPIHFSRQMSDVDFSAVQDHFGATDFTVFSRKSMSDPELVPTQTSKTLLALHSPMLKYQIFDLDSDYMIVPEVNVNVLQKCLAFLKTGEAKFGFKDHRD